MSAMWQPVAGTRRVAFATIGLDLRDDFTGGSLPDPVTLQKECKAARIGLRPSWPRCAPHMVSLFILDWGVRRIQ